MAAYRKDKTPGVYIRHEQGCSHENADIAGKRCKCSPSFRGKTRSHGWSRTFKTRAEAEGWKADVKRGLVPVPDRDAQTVDDLTFRAIVEQWWQAVENSEVGTRKRRREYSPNTLRQYRTALDVHVLPAMGYTVAAELHLRDWQKFVDSLRRKGLKTNSINSYINPVRAVYGWACSPRREILPANAIAGVELPPVDETARDRVAPPAEAAQLLAALEPDDQIVWGLGFYTGCRAMEIGGDRAKGTPGVDWRYVDFEQGGLFVPDSKSEAGVRWVPMVQPLRMILLTAWNTQGRPSEGRVVVGSVRSAKERALGREAAAAPSTAQAKQIRAMHKDGMSYDQIAATLEIHKSRVAFAVRGRARTVGAWERAGLEPIGLHECRHTFVSYMAAAGVPTKLRSEIAGHENEAMTRHYTHTLPAQVVEAGRLLDAYLEASA